MNKKTYLKKLILIITFNVNYYNNLNKIPTVNLFLALIYQLIKKNTMIEKNYNELEAELHQVK